MSSKADLWERLASELKEEMRQDLHGVRARGGVRKRGAAMISQGGAVRTRGAVRGGAQPTSESLGQVPVVIVEVPKGQPSPSEEKVKSKIGLQGILDLYYVVKDKHWAALGPRELNPDDEGNGKDHRLYLRNLKPNFVLLVPSEKGHPAWCDPKTQVVEW